MTRFSVLTVVVGFFVAGCGSNTQTPPTAPTTTTATTATTAITTTTFTAQLLPSKVRPAVTGGEAGGAGDVTMTLNVTKNGGSTIAATAAFRVNITTAFPVDSLFIAAAHVHRGAATTECGSVMAQLQTHCATFVIDTMGIVAPGKLFPARLGVLIDTPALTINPAGLADELLSNQVGVDSDFYFDISTASNTNGVARGQLVKR